MGDDEVNENMANEVPTRPMIPSLGSDVCLESNLSVNLSPGTVFNDGKHEAALSKLLASPSQDIHYLNSNGNGVEGIQVMSVSPGTALDDKKREAVLQQLLATQSDDVLDANIPCGEVDDTPAVNLGTSNDFGFNGGFSLNFEESGDTNFGFGCEMNNEGGDKDDGFSLFGGNDENNSTDGGIGFSFGDGDKLEMGVNANTSADFGFFDAAGTSNDIRGEGVVNTSFCLSFGGDRGSDADGNNGGGFSFF